MNIILFDKTESCDNRIVLSDRRARHIRSVLGAKTGETVRVGMLNGPRGNGAIEDITDEKITLLLTLDEQATPAPRTDLILALPRPIMLKRVLKQAACLGIGRIFLINAARVEKSFFQASLLEESNYIPFLHEGLEQAADTHLPQVTIFRRFRHFIEDYLPEVTSRYEARLVAHPETENALHGHVRVKKETRILIAIGPEGGWVDFELDMFRSHGFTPVSLGPRILRVDMVLPYVIAQIDMLRAVPA